MTSPDPSLASRERLQALYEISRALNSSLDLDEALVKVVDSAIRLIGAERGCLLLIDSPSGRLDFRIARNAERETLTETVFGISRSVVRAVLSNRQPIATVDAQTDPRFRAKSSSIVRSALRSIMAVPLTSRDQLLGLLYVDSLTRDILFTESDLSLLATFADQAGGALANAQLYQRVQREAELNRILLDVAHLAQQAATAGELIESVVTALPDLIGCERCAWLDWDAAAESFSPAAALHPDHHNTPPPPPILHRHEMLSVWHELTTGNRPVRIAEANLTDGVPREWAANFRLRALAVAPIRAGEELLGALVVDHGRRDRTIPDHELLILEALAHQLASAIIRLRLFETTQRQVRELSLLHAVAVAATAAGSIDELVHSLAGAIRGVFRPDHFGVSLLDERLGGLRPHPALADATRMPEVIPLDQGIVGRVARTGQPARLDDVAADPDYLGLIDGSRSELCVPLKIGERVIGVLNAESSRPAAFRPDDERLLITIAGQVSVTIEKLRLFEVERQQRELAEALRDAGLALSAEFDLASLWERMLAHIGRVVPYHAATILLADEGHVGAVEARGYDQLGPEVEQWVAVMRLEIASTWNLRQMAETGRPLVVPDVVDEPRWIATATTALLRSWAGAPIIARGRLLAFISLERREPGFYTAEHGERLAAFAGQAALAMQNILLLQEAQQQAAELDALRQASLSITANLDLPTVLNSILDSALKLMPGAQDAHLFTYDGQRLKFGAALWADGRSPNTYSEPRPEGLTYTAARRGEPIIVQDMSTHPLFEGMPPDWTGSIVGLPIKTGERVVGVMNVAHPRLNAFSEAAVRRLQLLVDQASLALENARLFDAARRQLDELGVLHALAAASAEATSLDALILHATELIGNLLHPINYGLMLLDDSGLTLQPHPTYVGRRLATMVVGQGVTGRVASTGRPLRLNDVRQDTYYMDVDPDALSELCLPLKAEDQVIGVINVESDRLNAFTDDDERLLATFAGQLGTAVQKARLFERERLARSQAETLRDVASLLNATLDQDRLLHLVLEHLNRLVAYDSASIMLVEGDRLQVVAQRGFRSEAQSTFTLHLSGLEHIQTVLTDRRPLMISDTRSDSRWLADIPGVEYIRCWLGVPLVVEERVIGLLNLDSQTPAFYTSQDAEAGLALANQAAVAIERLRLLAETQRRQAELSLLLSAARAVASSLDMQAALQQVATAIVEAMRVELCTFSVLDAERNAVRTAARHAARPNERLANLTSLFFLDDYPATARVIQQNQASVVRGFDSSADGAEVALLREMNYAVLAMLPLSVGGRPVGLMEMYTNDRARDFSPDDLRLARAVADQAAVAVENARLFQFERDQRELSEALREIGATVGASLDMETVLSRLLEQVPRVAPCDAANLMLVERGRARVVRAHGYEAFESATTPKVVALEFEIDSRPNIRQIMETRQPLVVADARQDPGWVWPAGQSPTAWAWMGAPIIAQGQVIAVLSLDSTQPGFFTRDHVRRLSAFADQAALALQNARLFEAERRRVDALTTLHDIGLELGTQPDLDSLVRTIVARAAQLLKAQRGLYYRVDQAAQSLRLLTGYNVQPEQLGRTMRLGEGLAGQVAQSAQPMIVDDYLNWPHRVPAFLDLHPRSAIGMPVIWQEHVSGVLVVIDNERPYRFSATDQEIVRLFADQAAIALENLRLYGELAEEKSRLELLYHLSQSLAETLDPQEVAERALELMRSNLRASRGQLFFLEPDGRLHLVAVAGYPGPTALDRGDVFLELGQGLAGWVAQNRRLVVIEDVQSDERWLRVPGADDDIRGTASLPLMVGDELFGVLSLLSVEPNFWQAEHLPLISAAAVPVALGLQNARLFQAEALRAHHLTLLNDITRTSLTTQDLITLLDFVAERLAMLMDADECFITLWDENRQAPIPMAAFGPRRDVYASRPPEAGQRGLTGMVLAAGHAVPVETLADRPDIPLRFADRPPIASVLGLPLIAGDQKLGAVIVAYHAPHRFANEAIQRGEQAANQIALAVAKTRLFDETRRHVDELAVAADLLRALSLTGSVVRNFAALAAGLRELARCDHVRAGMMTNDGQTFTLIDPDVDPAARPVMPVAASAVTADVLAGHQHLTDDLSAELDFPVQRAMYEAGYRSVAALPLRGSGGIIGGLIFYWRTPGGPQRANVTLLQQVTDAFALAIEKERLLDETLRRAQELEALTAISAALRPIDTTAEAMQLLVSRSLTIFRADTGAVAVPGDEHSLSIAHAQGFPFDMSDFVFDLAESVMGRVFASGQPHLFADLHAESNAHPRLRDAWDRTDARPRAMMFAPLRAGADVIGVVTVSAPEPRVFSAADLRLFDAVAEIGGGALQRAGVLETLEQRVAERTHELAEANERLKELDRLKDQFVSSVSHELRTPLTAIKLHLGLLEKRGAELLPRYLPILQRETERLRRLIEDLLDLSRLRAQPLPHQLETYQLDALIAEVMALHLTRAETRNVWLTHVPDPHLPPVPVDRAQMIQVFTNLIGNAVAYTPVGGRVTIASGVVASSGADGAQVNIHNDGPAIAADDLPHLFTRFYRGRIGRDSGEPGTGLGLAICKEIVERHGGMVSVSSTDEHGTTFSIWLPLRPEPPVI